jgi:hypothetical protein
LVEIHAADYQANCAPVRDIDSQGGKEPTMNQQVSSIKMILAGAVFSLFGARLAPQRS